MTVEWTTEIHVIADDDVPEGEAWLAYGSRHNVLAKFKDFGQLLTEWSAAQEANTQAVGSDKGTKDG